MAEGDLVAVLSRAVWGRVFGVGVCLLTILVLALLAVIALLSPSAGNRLLADLMRSLWRAARRNGLEV